MRMIAICPHTGRELRAATASEEEAYWSAQTQRARSMPPVHRGLFTNPVRVGEVTIDIDFPPPPANAWFGWMQD
jgi:hypothetical protein